MLICHCFKVTDKEIKKCKTLKEVREKTNATRGCGACKAAVLDILKKDKPADLV